MNRSRSIWGRSPFLLVAVVFAVGEALAQPSETAARLSPVVAQRNTVTTSVGMEGRFLFDYEGTTLTTKPPKPNSGITVDIANVEQGDGVATYELRYIATQPGTYDLRDWLDLPAADSNTVPLDKMVVMVQSVLPKNHDGELSHLPQPPVIAPLRYRLLLTVILTLWTVPLLWMALRLIT